MNVINIKNVTINTNDMTYEEVNALVQQLRTIRARKEQAKRIVDNFHAMIENIREEGFDFCCEDTGEVLDPKYWVLYDSVNHCTYPKKEEN
jgi:hypothetical protein